MVDIRKVHERGVASMSAAFKEAELEYQQAALANDVDGMAAAGMKMAGLDATLEKFNALAHRTANPQPQQYQEPRNRYGLTATEEEIARNSFHAPDMNDDQKQQLYAQNRAKYQHMRATGAYRDDQGTVRR